MENNLTTVTLPISGIVVTLRTRLTLDEKNEAEAVLASATKTTVVDGVPQQHIEGSVGQLFIRRLMETFIVRAENPDGTEFQINIKMGTLDSEDGDFLQEEVSARYNAIKKKRPAKL